MLELEVDCKRFMKLFPREVRQRTARFVAKEIEGRTDVNETFFGNMATFHHQPFYIPEMSIPDLFAPNICAIDFALDHLSHEADLILDWGCGLGTCGQYLTQLGFRVCGYDNWSQLPKEVAERFQARFDAPLWIVDDFRDIEPTVMMHVSMWCLDREAWDRPSVKWILSDTHYAENTFDAPTPPGFKLYGEYTAKGRCKNYLTVFRREM